MYSMPPDMPGRVRAALEYLQYCLTATHPYDCTTERTQLGQPESAVRHAALDVLRLYFSGEMDYGDAPPTRPQDPPEPTAPIPVKV